LKHGEDAAGKSGGGAPSQAEQSNGRRSKPAVLPEGKKYA